MLINTLENILQKIDMERGYQLLTPRERKIISLYYLEGYKDEETAKIYGVCQQNINRQRKRGIAKINKFIFNFGDARKKEGTSAKMYSSV